MHDITEIKVAQKQALIAQRICEEAHKGQTRWNGDAYATHPTRIAKTFTERIPYSTSKVNDRPIIDLWERATVAYLHDVLEDCEGWTVNRLIDEGLMPHLAWAVTILTKLPGETYLPYILRLKASDNKIAYDVKVADIHDNLRDLHEYDNTGKMIDRYQMALFILEHYDQAN